MPYARDEFVIEIGGPIENGSLQLATEMAVSKPERLG
jgi:hypothetical protein